jgi:lipopolysaccharide export system protein LptA
MWTPKRLLMLFLGFLFFLCAYVVYDFFLGHYDGLPPLPPEFQPVAGDEPVPEPRRPGPSGVVALLEKAFGANCEEKDRRIKLEWRTQNIVLAAENWKLQDGRLHLEKVSVAFFGKNRPGAENAAEEINTVRGTHAEVEFERPLNTLRDAQKSKPVAGRIEGNVILQHNRRTPQPEDDIRLFTKWLAYREDQHRIWTDADIRLLDHHPPQATITAEGMEVLLLPQDKTKPVAKGPTAAPKPPQSSVKEVRLLRKVDMNLLLEQGSQFLSGSSLPKEAHAVKKNGPRTPVVITCQGPFTYFAQRDQAEFTDHVVVLRRHPQTAENQPPTPRYDQLDCERLLLTFTRTKGKETTPGKSAEKGPMDEGSMAITTAHAMGKPLDLRSDADGPEKGLHVIAVELLYDKANAQTTLVGGKDGLQAEMQGHQLRLFGTLELFHAPESTKDLKEARARGPGEITMANREEKAGTTNKRPPVTARWQEEMRWTKEPQPKGLPLDRIIFTGQAAFEDPERGRLSAAQLAVWLEPKEQKLVGPPVLHKPKDEKLATSSPLGNQRTQLKRVDAVGDVRLFSRELLIPHADRMRLLFTEAVEQTPKATAAASVPPPGPPAPPMPPELLVQRQQPTLPPPTTKSKAPLELRAKVVDATLQQSGGKTDVERMQAEGEVKVTQAAINPTDKPIDIRADRLDLIRYPTGHVIKLFSPEENPASAQVDRMVVLGPFIELDQTQNIVQVTGQGRMRMPSKSDFQGQSLKEPTDVVITWSRRMLFDGRSAEFDGKVSALQGNALLSCDKMTVVLDRQISLRERLPEDKGKEQPAQLRRLLCNKEVRLEKQQHEGTPQYDYQRVQGEQLDFDNQQGQLIVQGPGRVDIVRPGQEIAPPPGGTTRAAERQGPLELKLTRIVFQGRMEAQPRNGLVTFSGGYIDVYHVSSKSPDVDLDADHLPPGGMHVTCTLLKGMSRKLENQQTVQEYEASHGVRVRMQEFSAQSDEMRYDEQKGWVVLDGRNGHLVTLSKQDAPGAKPKTVRASQIIYRIKEGTFHLNGTDSLNVLPK